MGQFRDHARSYSARAAAYSVDLDHLAEGHTPPVMIITCSDARLVPALITGSRPGDLLELRTHGGTVPRFDKGSLPRSSARRPTRPPGTSMPRTTHR
ncbi:carbonic anhydrase [Streptomyces niveus]|uniref:carbonic anhydrase n=1 Tax=Streptomyces niveus TaxID=193462 RepID=UPI00365A6C5A